MRLKRTPASKKLSSSVTTASWEIRQTLRRCPNTWSWYCFATLEKAAGEMPSRTSSGVGYLSKLSAVPIDIFTSAGGVGEIL